MTFTIEQLEALKEGTTPGPWKFREHSDYEYPAGPEWGPMQTELEHAVLDAEDNHLFGAYNNYKMIERPGNVPLAASAPDLVDALIAEKRAHAKLRAEVEELRDALATEAEGPHYEGDYGDGRYSGLKQATAFITRILEGNG